MILGQLDSAANTLETLYTVPNTCASASVRVTASNRGSATTITIQLRKAGEATNVKQQTRSAFALAAAAYHETPVYELDKSDVVSVLSVSGDVTFNAVGIEHPGD